MRSQAFKLLKDLGPDIMEQIDDKLLRKLSPQNVAKWLQEDQKLLLDSKPDSLKKTLERYRETELRKRVVSSVVDMTRGRTTATVAGKIHAMSELEELCVIQRARFDKLFAIEQNGKLLMGGVTGEAKLLKDMLVDLGKMQLETGVIPRAPRVVAGVISDTSTGEHRAFTWTDEQESLFRRLENVIEHEERQ